MGLKTADEYADADAKAKVERQQVRRRTESMEERPGVFGDTFHRTALIYTIKRPGTMEKDPVGNARAGYA